MPPLLRLKGYADKSIPQRFLQISYNSMVKSWSFRLGEHDCTPAFYRTQVFCL